MELGNYKEVSQEYSKQASELVRQFAFAGIAIVWIFKIDVPDELLQFILRPSNGRLLPGELLLPLLCMVSVLTMDLLQNYLSYLIWSIFYRKHEKSGMKPNDEIKASPSLAIPSKVLFHGKIGVLIFGYAILISFILQRL